jgi:xanthine dehydrogenase YagR molybdenum-binding subunit
LSATKNAAVGLVPNSSPPGSEPDPLIRHQHGLIGKPVSRLDGPFKVTGEARFAAEFPLEGMAYAALAYATVAKGRMVTLDTRAAEAAPGVALVMTYRNAPRMKAPPLGGSAPKAAGQSDLPIMQDDQIHWNGQPIALVLAETQEQADHASSLIRAIYQTEPAVTAFEHAKSHARLPETVLGQPSQLELGNAEAALAASSCKTDLSFHTPRYNHCPIELHAATVVWEGDRLVVHDQTRLVKQAAWTLAQIFGLEEDQVHILSPYVGGAFGSKTFWSHQVLAAAAARLARRPVRIVLSREGEFRAVGGRTTTEQRVAIGAQADGCFSALIHVGTAAMTAHNNCPEQFTFPARHLYSAGSIKVVQRVADMDMIANTFMRAPGESIGTFALECAIDELAEQLRIDPIELRIRNEPEKDPTSGKPFSARHLVDAYRVGAERFGWDERDPKPGARREGEWLIGAGCATATYPYYRFPGAAASISLSKNGHATVAFAAHELGMGTATVHTQVVADRLGLPLEQVTVVYGDSSLPGAFVAGGSSQTAAIGAAVIAAHRALVTELLNLVGNDSPLAGLTADEVGCRDGGLCELDKEDRFESYVSILSRAHRDEVTVEASAPMPPEMTQWSMHSFGAQFAEVGVNTVTGETRVRRFLGSFDCGRILNSKTAAGQLRGGIIMGLGLALMEETQFDERNGRIMNPSLAEYHVPVHMDVPKIDVIWTDIPDPHAPMGARGIGEIGITGVGAAIANAVYNATGKRIRSLPITPDKLL